MDEDDNDGEGECCETQKEDEKRRVSMRKIESGTKTVSR